MTKTKQRELWRSISDLLEDWTLEELLERFDITQEDALLTCYEAGLVDPLDLSSLVGFDVEEDDE